MVGSGVGDGTGVGPLAVSMKRATDANWVASRAADADDGGGFSWLEAAPCEAAATGAGIEAADVPPVAWAAEDAAPTQRTSTAARADAAALLTSAAAMR